MFFSRTNKSIIFWTLICFIGNIQSYSNISIAPPNTLPEAYPTASIDITTALPEQPSQTNQFNGLAGTFPTKICAVRNKLLEVNKNLEMGLPLPAFAKNKLCSFLRYSHVERYDIQL